MDLIGIQEALDKNVAMLINELHILLDRLDGVVVTISIPPRQ